MRGRTQRITLLILLPAFAQTTAEDVWRLGFHSVGPARVLDTLEEVFDFSAQNPDAECLNRQITYTSQRHWPWREGPEAIIDVMANACCDVTFGAFQTYRLSPAQTPNLQCLITRSAPESTCRMSRQSSKQRSEDWSMKRAILIECQHFIADAEEACGSSWQATAGSTPTKPVRVQVPAPNQWREDSAAPDRPPVPASTEQRAPP